MGTTRTKGNGENAETRRENKEDEGLARLRVLLGRTSLPDPAPEDVKAIRGIMKAQPEAWKSVWDLNAKVQDQLTRNLVGVTTWQKEAMNAGVEHLRKELGHEKAPMLEKLLIEQIMLCWMHYHHTHLRYNQAVMESGSEKQGEYHERRLNAAQRRYLRAIDHLARIRKMSGRPPLQINIAQQQVNVAG